MTEIKKASTEGDIEKIAALARQIWQEHFTPIIGKEQVEYMLQKFQSYSAVHQAVFCQGYSYYMLYEDDVLCGYCGVHPENGDLFLSKLYIEKSHRGKKLSKALLAQVKKDFSNCRKIWLTVNRHNKNTIAAYKKMGFSTVAEQKADIGNGFVMDDYIMECAL